MQFIATTHSPLVLAGCRADEVWVLRQDANTGDVIATASDVELSSVPVANSIALSSGRKGIDAERRPAALCRAVQQPYRSDSEDAEAMALKQKLRHKLGEQNENIYDRADQR